jgi:hypothetical protein
MSVERTQILTNLPIKNAAKVIIAAIAACTICCASFVVPILIGLVGVGAFGVGMWLVGGVFVLAALVFVIRRRKKACGCAAFSKCGA